MYRIIFLLVLFFNILPAQGGHKQVFVINSVANTLSVVDPVNQTVILDTLSPGATSFPNQMVLHGGKGYVVSSGIHSILVFETAGLQRLGTIQLPTGTNPWAMGFINDSLAAVSFFDTDEVGIVNVNSGQLLTTVPVGTSPEGVRFSNGRIFVANSGFVSFGQPYDPGTVSVIDAATFSVVGTVPVGLNPQDLDTDSNGNIVVACTGDYGVTATGQLDIIHPASLTVIHSESLNEFITAVRVNPSDRAYLATFGFGVLVYDLVTQTFEVDGSNPLTGGPGVDFDAAGNAYICEFGDGSSAGKLRMFSPAHQLLHTFGVNVGPVYVAVDDPAFTVLENPNAPVLQTGIELLPNYPNPFNPETVLGVRLIKGGETRLDIFNLSGQKVRTLFNGKLAAGLHRFVWDGRDTRNRSVSAGIYFYRIKSNGAVQVRRMVLQK